MAGSHFSALSVREFSGKTGNFSIFHGPITVGTLAGFLTQWGALKTAIDTVTNGVLAKEQITMDNTILSALFPVSEFAQRGNKWLVHYVNTVSGKPYELTIPCADPTGRLNAGTDIANMANADIIALVAAVEAIGRSPENDADGINVDKIEFVNYHV